jgi:hypothetical protein
MKRPLPGGEENALRVGQQAAEHGLCPQGELRSTVELRARGLMFVIATR